MSVQCSAMQFPRLRSNRNLACQTKLCVPTAPQSLRTNGKSVGCQTGEALDARWAAFLRSLPPPPALPAAPLAAVALGEAIVRVYLRALGSVEVAPVWGAPRTDTVYDAIMAHYTAQAATPGAFDSLALQVGPGANWPLWDGGREGCCAVPCRAAPCHPMMVM
jgi:hypothetical protein